MKSAISIVLLALALCGCVYEPTVYVTAPPFDGGYVLNDNGYQAYYTVKDYKVPNCASVMTYRCQDRLEYDDVFCARWSETGRCGDAAATNEPSKEIKPIPPGGRWTLNDLFD